MLTVRTHADTAYNTTLPLAEPSNWTSVDRQFRNNLNPHIQLNNIHTYRAVNTLSSLQRPSG